MAIRSGGHQVWLILLGSLLLGSCAAVPQPTSQLDADLSRITRLLVGDYFSSADEGVREGRPIYLRIRQVTPPAGQNIAIYSEMRHDGPDGDFYRQLVYLFDESADRPDNRMTAYGVSDKAQAAGLINDPDALARGAFALTPGIAQACYTVWTRNSTGFEGYIDPERCIITGKRGDQRRIESRMSISPDWIGQLERGFSLEGDLLFGDADGKLMIWPRVQPGDRD